MSAFVSPPPFGIAREGHGLRVYRRVKNESDAGVLSNKDISGARWTYRIRAWVVGSEASPVIDDVITKSATDSANGLLDHYQALGGTTYSALQWEIVEVDNDNADTSSKTSKREIVLVSWTQPIVAAPSA